MLLINRSLIVVVALAFSPVVAKAAVASFDCESESGELVGCASLPPEAKDVAPAQDQAPIRKAPAMATARAKNQISLLMRSELSGADSTPSPHPLVSGDSSTGSVNPAMLAAVETEAQLRRVELFLKSGPASHSNLRVVETQK